MNFKIRQLEGFVAAAEEGAFSRAAERMSLTQPAFSQLIRELEGAVGVRLFERTTRRVELTEAGRLLLAQIRRPLDDLEFAYRSLLEIASGERGSITFATLPSTAFVPGTRAIAHFRQLYPAVQIRQIEDQNGLMIEKVLNREVDFGVGMLTQPDADLTFAPLFEDELVAVLREDDALAARNIVSWADLASAPMILMPAPSSARRLAEAGLALAGVGDIPAFEVANMVTGVSMVREGLGHTVMPLLALESLKMEGLIYRQLGEPRPIRQMGLIHRTDRPLTRAAQAFVACLAEEARKLARVVSAKSPTGRAIAKRATASSKTRSKPNGKPNGKRIAKRA